MIYVLRNFRYSTQCDLTHLVALMQGSVIFLFPISPVQLSIKNMSKPLFQHISSFTKINKFDNVKVSRSISYEDGF